jgi:hypothetical protein
MDEDKASIRLSTLVSKYQETKMGKPRFPIRLSHVMCLFCTLCSCHCLKAGLLATNWIVARYIYFRSAAALRLERMICPFRFPDVLSANKKGGAKCPLLTLYIIISNRCGQKHLRNVRVIVTYKLQCKCMSIPQKKMCGTNGSRR